MGATGDLNAPGPGAPGGLFISAVAGSKAARPPNDSGARAGEGPGLPGLPRTAAILGAPLDRTTSYRPGTARGPAAIRAASWSLETYSPSLDGDLAAQTVFDLGDVELSADGGFTGDDRVERDLGAIEAAVVDACRQGFLPVVLGGEHIITLAAYRGAAWVDRPGAPGPPVFFHFDAHADLRDAYEGAALSHATVVRRVADICGGGRVFQFGIRSGSREEMSWGRANVNRVPGTLAGAAREALRRVAGRRLYCSVDIDIFDPADAPGTGNPEPGGPPAADVVRALVAVAKAAAAGPNEGGVDLVGFDLVEVSPAHDPTGRTEILAAKVLREFLIARTRTTRGRRDDDKRGW